MSRLKLKTDTKNQSYKIDFQPENIHFILNSDSVRYLNLDSYILAFCNVLVNSLQIKLVFL
jgi:hypothetical protein